MANENTRAAQAPANAELDKLAFEIFSKRAATRPAGEQAAVESYKAAEAFLAVRAKVQTEGIASAVDDSPLSDVSAPNQPPTYPLNLVSRKFGDLERVKKIAKWLEQNPTPEDPSYLFASFKRAFPDLHWQCATEAETLGLFNVARAVFPHYAKV